jgi:two-component system, sporulation sensor kinase E
VTPFIARALKTLPRLNLEQLKNLLIQLADENERLESVLDSMTDGIMVADAAHSLIEINKSAERLLPVLGGERLERPAWQCVDDDDISAFLRHSLENHERISDREFTLDSQGNLRILAISIMPLVSRRSVSGSLIHIEDITEKRSREARLRRAENLASLTTLSAGVAHEIKNPLASISIHIQLLKKMLKGKDKVESEKLAHHLDVVSEEIERLNGIVVDFLFAVRPINLELATIDPNSFLREVFDFMQYELSENKIELEMGLAERLPKLAIDTRLMKQAILNLVKNAIHAMPRGGRLSVGTERENDTVKISIQDSGEGISPENITKIFEPYFTTRDSGNGLGLTLVFKIVKEHQGEIQVQSKPGYGARFTIILPIPQSERRLLEYGA